MCVCVEILIVNYGLMQSMTEALESQVKTKFSIKVLNLRIADSTTSVCCVYENCLLNVDGLMGKSDSS